MEQAPLLVFMFRALDDWSNIFPFLLQKCCLKVNKVQCLFSPFFKLLTFCVFVYERSSFRHEAYKLLENYQALHWCRDSRFSRLGIETPRLSVQVSSQNRSWNRKSDIPSLGSEPEPKLRHSKSRNRNRNRKSDILSLGIRTGIESQTFQVSESEPESKYSVSRVFL